MRLDCHVETANLHGLGNRDPILPLIELQHSSENGGGKVRCFEETRMPTAWHKSFLSDVRATLWFPRIEPLEFAKDTSATLPVAAPSITDLADGPSAAGFSTVIPSAAVSSTRGTSIASGERPQRIEPTSAFSASDTSRDWVSMDSSK